MISGKLGFVLLFLLSFSIPARSAQKAQWYGKNAEALDRLLKEFGSGSPSYDPKAKPVAVFDWDNTMIKNDIGDATFFWMVSRGLFKRPADWSKTSQFLTQEAAKVLSEKCAGESKNIPTDKNAACADLVMDIYNDGKLPGGKDAWLSSYNKDTMEPAYAWILQLGAGYKPADWARFAKSAMDFNLKNKVGAKQKIGSKEYVAYIRIYPQMHSLVTSLQKKGFDVWISSASLQYIVEVIAKKVGVAKDHVIGVRPVLDGTGAVTASFQSCGTHADGPTLINYRQGKRCWLNKIVFKEKDPAAMMDKASPTVFAAGDSDTDAFFVKDARGLRLAINRNKAELMCNAYANQDQKWIVNPMFIEPKAQKTSKYDCSKYGLPPQTDSVF